MSNIINILAQYTYFKYINTTSYKYEENEKIEENNKKKIKDSKYKANKFNIRNQQVNY